MYGRFLYYSYLLHKILSVELFGIGEIETRRNDEQLYMRVPLGSFRENV